MMKNFSKLGALLLAGSLFLTGCGGSGDKSSTTGSQDANTGEKIELNFSWWGSDDRHEALTAVADLYMKQNDNVTIKTEYGPFDGHQAKMMTQLTGKTEPDIMQVNYNWIHSFGKGKNVFLDLNTVSDKLKLDGWDAAQIEAMTVGGELAAVPHGVTARAPLYNKPLFETNGLDYPATYEDLIAAAKVIGANNSPTGAENQYVLTNIGPQSTDLFIAQMLFNKTGKIMQSDGTINYTVDDVKAAFEQYKAFEDSGAIPTFQQEDPIENESNPVWTSGRSGSVYEWIGTMNKYLLSFKGGEAKEELGVAPYITETKDQKISVYTKPSLGYAISKNSKNPEAAADFLNFMFTNEEAIKLIGTSLGISSNTNTRAVQDASAMLEGAMKEGYELLATYDQTIMDPYFEDENVRGARYKAIEGFRSGDLSVDEAAKNYVEQQQEELTKLLG